MNKARILKRIERYIKENTSYLITLVAVFCALTLIVGITFGIFYSNARRDVITIGNLSVAEEAEVIDKTLLIGVNTLRTAAIAANHMLEQGATYTDIYEYIKAESIEVAADIDSSISSLYGVVDDHYIDGIDWEPPEGYNPYERPYYIAAKESEGKVVITSPYLDAQTGGIIVSYGIILKNGKDGIFMDKVLDDIHLATKNISLYGYGYCFVVDNTGVVVAHKNDDEKGKNYLSPEMEGTQEQNLIKKLYAEDNNNYLEMKIDGKRCMVYSEEVQEDWRVILVVNESDMFSTIRINLAVNIAISLVIFVLVGYFCTSNYKNKKKALQYALEVRTDTLTGLNNRGEFDRFLSATTGGIPEGLKLYLILFDTDKFKDINDNFGHPEGDKALKRIAEAMKTVCHGTDNFCARFGGDEFVIVCKCADFDSAIAVAESVNEQLEKLVKELELKYNLVLSYGIAEYDAESKQTVSELIDEADSQLYIMKSKKKANNYKK